MRCLLLGTLRNFYAVLDSHINASLENLAQPSAAGCDIVGHFMAQPVRELSEKSTFHKTDDQLFILRFHRRFILKKCDVFPGDIFAHFHKLEFIGSFIRRTPDMVDSFFVLYYIFQHGFDAFSQSFALGEGAYFICLFNRDLVQQIRNVLEMVVEGVAVDAAVFHDILYRDF